MDDLKVNIKEWHKTRFLPKCTACKKYLLFPRDPSELTCLNCGSTIRYLTNDYAQKVYDKVNDLIESQKERR